MNENTDSLYPTQLFPIADLKIKHNDIMNVVEFYRYLGMTLCEALCFQCIEVIFREYSEEKLKSILDISWDRIFVNKSNSNTQQQISEKQLTQFRESNSKLMNLLKKYHEIMIKNKNTAFYEILYDYYKNCQANDQLKIASVMLIKNYSHYICKKRGVSEKEMKKFELFKPLRDNLYDKDLNFLAECFGIHIHVYSFDTKGIFSSNYKEKNFVEKPIPVKILQKHGKFYGLYSHNHIKDIDNLIFLNTIDFFDEKSEKKLTQIPRNSIGYKISDKDSNPKPEKKEKEVVSIQKIDLQETQPSEKSNLTINRIFCCICHNEILKKDYFINPSCNHIYCYQCIIQKCEQKQFLNLCFEKICTKTLALSRLEKFLLEMSMNQTSQSFSLDNNMKLIDHEQECYNCHKMDNIFMESFLQFEYYKCFHCQKISCILHKAPMENCFCFCLKCLEQTYCCEYNTQKKCFNCKEIYCIICHSNIKLCHCYCKICGSATQVKNDYCVICIENCQICNLYYGNKNILRCEKKGHIFCKFCVFKDPNFISIMISKCILCKK